MKITKKQFKAYERVRQSGRTNMFDVNKVIELAWWNSNIRLTKKIIVDIMMSYNKLSKKYAE